MPQVPKKRTVRAGDIAYGAGQVKPSLKAFVETEDGLLHPIADVQQSWIGKKGEYLIIECGERVKDW